MDQKKSLNIPKQSKSKTKACDDRESNPVLNLGKVES